MPLRQPRRAGLLLVTSQTTSYNSEADDGFYQAGLQKRYEILTVGQHAGTSAIDLVHLTAITIAFAATTPGTITDTGADLAMFKTGETIVITGSGLNDGVYTVSTGNVAGTIRTTEATVLEAAGATVSIAKREAHSNECVQDLVTGLMWSRYTSAQYATMGIDGDGTMPWTGQLYDIFQYAAAANAASLGGYTDWRITNDMELLALRNMEVANAAPDPAGGAFPAWPRSSIQFIWTSTTNPADIAKAMSMYFFNGGLTGNPAKTVAYYVALARGGV